MFFVAQVERNDQQVLRIGLDGERRSFIACEEFHHGSLERCFSRRHRIAP
jgi:hypothetical protein